MSRSRSLPSGPERRFAGDSVLGPTDPRTVALAAELLRERTMSLDPDESEPARRLVMVAIGFTVATALCLILFRHQLRWMLSLVT